MAWLRLYDDILDDPKVQMLSDRAFRMFINCLALAKRLNGKLPREIEILAFSLHQPINRTRETFQVLLSSKLIDRTEDGYTPHNWNGRQYISDVSTERVKRFRGVSSTVSETPMKRFKAVSETPPEDRVQKTEPEKKKEDAPQAAPPPSKPMRGIRWKAEDKVSDDWIREGEMRRIECGLPPINLAVEAECFANYWASKTGKDATKINWHMTWMNRALKAEGPRNGRGQRESVQTAWTRTGAELIAELDARDAATDHPAPNGSGPKLLEAGHAAGREEGPVAPTHRRSIG